jgi:septum formation protein
MVQIILASASPSRLRLLESVGISPKVALAILKAHTVKELAPADSLIIGCDSTFEFEGKSLGKPGSKENAIARCKQLSGKSGYLHTGHCVIDLKNGIELSERSTSKVQFAQMTDAEINDYVDSGEPLNVAGGFTLDGLSAPFITNIEGDPSGIIGLSLPLLRKMVISLGYSWPDLKNK